MTPDASSLIVHYYSIHRYLTMLALLGIWVASFGGACLAGLAQSLTVRCLWGVSLGLAGFLASSYSAITKTNIQWDALQLILGNTFLARGVVDTYGQELLLPAALNLCLALVVILPPAVPRWKGRWIAFSPLLPALMIFAVFCATMGDGVSGLPSPFSLLGLLPGFLINGSHPMHNPVLAEALRDPPAARNILFIVDESVRGDFIDLNMDQGTTPYLKSMKGSIINFGIVSSAANCSASSNSIMRLGANPASMSGGKDIRANPTIWRYAHQAGFQNIYIDGQSTGGTLQNNMDEAERKLIDRFIQPGGPLEGRDMAAAGVLTGLLREPGRHFVYLNKYGAHFPYQSGYPQDKAVFSPHMVENEELVDRERMVNSYKNNIHWSVDAFFKKLLPQMNSRDTLIIYTSDHGQNLLDDGIPVTHCRAHRPLSEEAEVPLFIFPPNEKLSKEFQEAARLNHDRASSFQIFPTILQLMGYDPKAVSRSYYSTLFESVTAPVGFASGGIFGAFGSRPNWNRFRFPSEAPIGGEGSIAVGK